MKGSIMYKKIVPFSLMMAALFALSGCGDSEVWGIDHVEEIEVTHGPLNAETGLYRCNVEDAMLVEAGEVVRPLTDDTQLRVWHYQNSQEYVCTLKGQAVKSQPTKG